MNNSASLKEKFIIQITQAFFSLFQPIHAAACWGHLEVVEVLAQNGANVSARTRNGETPLDICEDPDIRERLVQVNLLATT